MFPYYRFFFASCQLNFPLRQYFDEGDFSTKKFPDFVRLNIFPFVNHFTKGTFYFRFFTFRQLNFCPLRKILTKGKPSPRLTYTLYIAMIFESSQKISLF